MNCLKKIAATLVVGLLAAGAGHAQQVKAKPRPARPTTTAPRPATAPAEAKKTAELNQLQASFDEVPRFFRPTPAIGLVGQPFSVAYSPAGTPLEGKAGVRAIVYEFDLEHLRWVASDLPLHPSGQPGELTGSFTPSPTAGFRAFKFVAADGSTDVHTTGYFQLLRDAAHPEGGEALGAYTGYGLLRKPAFGYSIPDYFRDYTISDEALVLWLSQELRFHPEQGPRLVGLFATALRNAYPTSYQPRAGHALTLVSHVPNLSETELLNLYYGYRDALGSQPQADSLASALRQQFPQGYLVRQEQLSTIGKVRDLEQKRGQLEAFLQAYPSTPAYAAPNRYVIDYSRAYQDLILLGIARHDYQPLQAYASQLDYGGLQTMYYKAVQVSIRPNILTAAQALPYATPLMQLIDAQRAHRPAALAYLSPEEWLANFDQTSNHWRIHYATLLAEQSQPAQAWPYVQVAQRIAGYADATLNDTEASLLHAGPQADSARLRQVLETSVHHNQASPRMLDWLRESYAATHPGGAGYDQYLAGLQDAGARQAARAELASQMVNKPVADFALRDLDGQLVRLSEQRGKTVVLDLWATWCVPCKASFPGMKLVQERYKNDPNVVFFFIDTEETTPGYQQQVRQFLTDKNFPFRVLLDQAAPGTKTLDATYARFCRDYKVSGIPQKLIIDPQGRLRFLTDGYKGSPSALADEIQDMVELARGASQ